MCVGRCGLESSGLVRGQWWFLWKLKWNFGLHKKEQIFLTSWPICFRRMNLRTKFVMNRIVQNNVIRTLLIRPILGSFRQYAFYFDSVLTQQLNFYVFKLWACFISWFIFTCVTKHLTLSNKGQFSCKDIVCSLDYRCAVNYGRK